jgi:hypothetical protein
MSHLIQGGKMLTKKCGTGITGVLRLLRPVKRIRSALLLGCCILLSVSHLAAQDALLKEYIYLEGRLLAVERQVVTVAAQQPVRNPDRATTMEFALYSPPGSRKSILAGIPGNRPTPAMHGAQSMDDFRVADLASFWDSACRQCGLAASENSALRPDTCRWHWSSLGCSAHHDGGNDDDL